MLLKLTWADKASRPHIDGEKVDRSAFKQINLGTDDKVRIVVALMAHIRSVPKPVARATETDHQFIMQTEDPTVMRLRGADRISIGMPLVV